jgi:hypothetical protein
MVPHLRRCNIDDFRCTSLCSRSFREAEIRDHAFRTCGLSEQQAPEVWIGRARVWGSARERPHLDFWGLLFLCPLAAGC